MRGEVNLEFIVFAGLMTLILAIASFSSLIASQGIAADNEVADARRISYIVASEVNLAAETGPGYVHSFQIPNFIYNGDNYTIDFNQSFLYVRWKSKTYSLPVLGNVSGTANPGSNMIYNNNGVITFG
jgi:hypothetical protein